MIEKKGRANRLISGQARGELIPGVCIGSGGDVPAKAHGMQKAHMVTLAQRVVPEKQNHYTT